MTKVEERSDTEAKGIRQYVESQTHDDENPVDLVQKVGSRRISGVTHGLFDVWMKKGDRWWVITEPTNLYEQESFKSIEQAFTFHLGIAVVLRDRARAEAIGEEGEAVSPAWRRFLRATDAMDEATEAEDYQAVGIRCREALLALVRQHRTAGWVPVLDEPPQVANFKAWMDIFAEALTTSRPRRYLKALAEKTWDLTVWLQHCSDASEWDAELVINATAHILNTFSLAIIGFERGTPRRCPQCDSYRVTQDGDIAEQEGRQGWRTQDVCLACGWRGEVTFEPWTLEYLNRLNEYLTDGGPEGDRAKN